MSPTDIHSLYPSRTRRGATFCISARAGITHNGGLAVDQAVENFQAGELRLALKGEHIRGQKIPGRQEKGAFIAEEKGKVAQKAPASFSVGTITMSGRRRYSKEKRQEERRGPTRPGRRRLSRLHPEAIRSRSSRTWDRPAFV